MNSEKPQCVRLLATHTRCCQQAAQAAAIWPRLLPEGQAPRTAQEKPCAREARRQPLRPPGWLRPSRPWAGGGGQGKDRVGTGPGHRPSTTGLAGHTHRAPRPDALPHGPHRRLMVRNAGPTDSAAGSARSPHGGPHPSGQHAPPGPPRPSSWSHRSSTPEEPHRPPALAPGVRTPGLPRPPALASDRHARLGPPASLLAPRIPHSLCGPLLAEAGPVLPEPSYLFPIGGSSFS